MVNIVNTIETVTSNELRNEMNGESFISNNHAEEDNNLDFSIRNNGYINNSEAN